MIGLVIRMFSLEVLQNLGPFLLSRVLDLDMLLVPEGDHLTWGR